MNVLFLDGKKRCNEVEHAYNSCKFCNQDEKSGQKFKTDWIINWKES